MTDTEIIDWYEKNPAMVFAVGGTWYWRAGYQMPHRKAASLRLAVMNAAGRVSVIG
jgi:hypothetical protein